MQGDVIRRRLTESIQVKTAMLDDVHVDAVDQIADALATALADGGKVLLCGNGGSAADATHLAAELVGRFAFDRAPLPALSLSDNASAVTCIANDYAFEEVFARQVRAHGREGDVLVALTTSGTSPNVVRAVDAAREAGLLTVVLTGEAGAPVAQRADLSVRVPSTDTPRIQEAHMLVGHTICELVETRLFGRAGALRA